MEYNYLIKYPFSKKAKKHLADINMDIKNVDEDLLKKSAVFLLKTIGQKQDDLEKQWHTYLTLDDKRIADIFVQVYPVSRILVELVDYTPLIQSFAVYYQKQLKYFLKNCTSEDELIDILADVCQEIKQDESKSKIYSINLVDYLKLDLGEEHKLVYSNLESGFLYFDKVELIDLLAIILKKRIIKAIVVDSKELPKMFLDYAEFIRKKVMEGAVDKLQSPFKPKINEFPPCFLELHNKLLSGKKLSHIENYSLAVFLVNIGYGFDELMEIFKHAPNYDFKIASYQIKKLLEKKYSVPNCSTIKTDGLCVKECSVKHPFQLFKPKKNVNSAKKEVVEDEQEQ